MKKVVTITVLAATLLSFAGCPKKPTILREEAKAPVAEVKPEAKPEVKPEVKAEPKQGEVKPVEVAKVAEEKPRELTAAERLAKLKEEFRFEDIHFDFDMYAIKEKDKDILNNLADWLMKNKDVRVLIEGHADDRGNHEYNLALGERRATSAREYLVTLGVSAARLSTISYGEEKVVCTEPSEDCWWRNRRAHFVIQE